MTERCFRELAHFHAWPTSCLLCAACVVFVWGWTCTAQRLCLIFCQLLQKIFRHILHIYARCSPTIASNNTKEFNQYLWRVFAKRSSDTSLVKKNVTILI